MPTSASAPTSWRQRLVANDPTLRVHLMGIGGAGLSAIAQVLLERGIQVSGSDRQTSALTEALASAGARIYPTQAAANLLQAPEKERPDVALISSAIGIDNPERQAAEALGIPVVKRRAFLGPLLKGRQVIGVAGAHGKSTTTAMIVQMLQGCGRDVGYIIGSTLPGFGNAHAGTDPWFVIEADEYDRMFLGLQPTLAVITNVEWDHPDCYPTPDDLQQAFCQFVTQVQPLGGVIACGDDPGVLALWRASSSLGKRWRFYGESPSAELHAQMVEVQPGGGLRAEVWSSGTHLGQLELQVPGRHNLRNALAALAVARRLELPWETALHALASYTGIARRFEFKGEAQGVTVIDDYAHHPSEVRATLAAARSRFGSRRLWAVFQPHTFSRTRSMLQKMADSFADADAVLVTDIYAAREKDDGVLSARDVVAASSHPDIRYSGSVEETADLLAQVCRPGDVVLTLGAGTSHLIGERLLQKLQSSQLPVGDG